MHEDRLKMFAYYYSINVWGDPETRSGPGSRKDCLAVTHSLEMLSTFTEQHDIRSIIDIPCGDFNWMSTYLEMHPEVAYNGFDIVHDLVERNRRVFPGYEFSQLDIVKSVPPPADLIFCKDLLNHLSRDEIVLAISNMRASGAKYLLATNNFGYPDPNEELERSAVHNSRHVDLTVAPFHYSKALWNSHYLGLWHLPDMERLAVPTA